MVSHKVPRIVRFTEAENRVVVTGVGRMDEG